MSAVTTGTPHITQVRRGTDEVRRDQLITAGAGLVCAVFGIAAALSLRGSTVALWSGLITLCVTPGCGLMCWRVTRDRLTRVLAVLAGSMTWSVLSTTVFAWLQATSLGLLIAVTAGAGGIGCAAFLVARARRPADEEQDAAAWTRAGANLSQKPRSVSHLSSSSKVLLVLELLVAAGLWVISVMKAHGHAVGAYGLLPALGVPFFAAVALSIGALLAALWLGGSAWPAAVTALGLLLVEFFATQKILTSMPLYSYVYKHIGVVDYVLHGGALNDPLDVYQQWPGFFAAGAALVRLSGRSPLTYANWAELFFEALNAITLLAIAKRFSHRRRIIPYIAVMLYLAASWEGQEYYAPQSLAFQLALLFQLFLLPLLEPERLRDPFRKRRWLTVPPLETQMGIRGESQLSRVGRAARAVGLIALFGAIMITHQLSPYIVFGGVAVLWLLGVLRNRALLLIFVVMIAGYPLLHLTAISQNPVLNVFDLTNATGTKGFVQASAAQAFGSDLAKVVCLGIWGGTGVSVLSYRRRLGVILIPLVFAVVPVSLVLVSNYGGEGIFRAFLFSSPWCALIIAIRLADLVRAPMVRLIATGAWALFAILASAQSADFGQFPVIQMPPEEVSAAAYFLNNAPVNSTLMQVADNFPGRLNDKYVLHNTPQLPNDPALDLLPQFDGNALNVISPKSLAEAVTIIVKGSAYLVVSPSMYAYVDYYQSFTPGTLPDLVRRLKASDYWKVWYQKDGTVIFQALPNGKPKTKRMVVKAEGHHGAT
jgi:hypothetical protein